MEHPYKLSDKALAILIRKVNRRYEEAWNTLNLMKFDELNVIKIVSTLYEHLDLDARTTLWDLVKARYKETGGIGVLEYGFLLTYLQNPSPVTKYSWETEVYRKRDRLSEAILSSTSDRHLEMEKAKRFWTDMARQYCDDMTDAVDLYSYKQQGIKYLMWVTQEDERVCAVCGKLDGELFRIEKPPSKKHWRCRCYLKPVR